VRRSQRTDHMHFVGISLPYRHINFTKFHLHQPRGFSLADNQLFLFLSGREVLINTLLTAVVPARDSATLTSRHTYTRRECAFSLVLGQLFSVTATFWCYHLKHCCIQIILKVSDICKSRAAIARNTTLDYYI
jgi:hypothetical protein